MREPEIGRRSRVLRSKPRARLSFPVTTGDSDQKATKGELKMKVVTGFAGVSGNRHVFCNEFIHVRKGCSMFCGSPSLSRISAGGVCGRSGQTPCRDLIKVKKSSSIHFDFAGGPLLWNTRCFSCHDSDEIKKNQVKKPWQAFSKEPKAKKLPSLAANKRFERNAGRGQKSCGATFSPTPGSLTSFGVRSSAAISQALARSAYRRA